ncbi:uncharacterized protein LOC132644250 [Lycium barbarum]|uniref:uncharacterized protein LOC132644250 n=1 Tax=Lycium barbarum TaxID=112863 RepID=UPI00293F207A|nr:uncharacterized protein LOC132644250 [Lycium barbarum]
MTRKLMEARAVLHQVQISPTVSNSVRKQIYLQLIGDRPRIPWKSLIIDNTARQEAQFTIWLYVQDILLTVDRLTKWEMSIDQQCVLCQTHNETRDHLFLHCEFSVKVWYKVMNWIQQPQFLNTDWGQHIQWAICKVKGKSQAARLFKMVYIETIYALWIERNQGIFEKRRRDWLAIAKDVAYICSVRAATGLRNCRSAPILISICSASC